MRCRIICGLSINGRLSDDLRNQRDHLRLFPDRHRHHLPVVGFTAQDLAYFHHENALLRVPAILFRVTVQPFG